MAPERDERIRVRAYQLWEEAGYPEGRHDEHWHQAAGEIDDIASQGTGEAGDEMPSARDADVENDIVPGTTGTAPDVSGEPTPAIKDSELKSNREKSKPDIEKASLTSL